MENVDFAFSLDSVKVIGEKYSEKLLLTLDTSAGQRLSLRFGVDETNEIRAMLAVMPCEREEMAEQYGDAWD